MTTLHDRGPVFLLNTKDGMTLRDYFAAHSVSGFIAAYAGEGIEIPKSSTLAKWAFELADEMVAARQRESQS